MSNIIKSDDEIKLCGKFIEYINKSGLDKEVLDDFLHNLLEGLEIKEHIRWQINDKGRTTAIFIPERSLLQISIKKLKEWLNNNSLDLQKEYGVRDNKMLEAFLILFVLTHEIEHSYQYFMGEGVVSAQNQMIKMGYKGIFDLFKHQDYILPRPIKTTRRAVSLILYKAKEDLYLLERNANVEALDLMCKCALSMDNKEMYNTFTLFRNAILKLGYLDSEEGSLEETYRKILMFDKFKKIREDVDMSAQEKVRYGLRIDEKERQLVLKLKV